MADTAPKVAEAERRESPSLVDKKAELLAEKIKTSNHFIAFTGAGISTSAGIPDFRGPDGVWTLRAQGRKRTGKATSTLQAIPTPTHMALVELQNRGLLKYLNRISELHGNSNREYCKDCGKEYIRDFRAVATYEVSVYDHRTGRKCVKCGGVLFDSIVNFGESLPEEPFKRAHDNAKKADLCLALGSSLTVTPANEIPEIVGKKKRGRGVGGQLVICNLQSTPLDGLSELRVWSTTDDLMIRVMEKLEIPIPKFILRRRLVLQLETTEAGKHQLVVQGVDEDGTPVTFLQSVKLAYNRRVTRSEPFAFNFRGELDTGTELKLELEFMGHYGEPNLEITHVVDGTTSRILHLLEYDPITGEWKTTTEEGADGNTGLERDVSIIDLTSD